MFQFDLALDKYWVTHIGYFFPVTTAELGTGITDGKLLFCHDISNGSKETIKKIVQVYNVL